MQPGDGSYVRIGWLDESSNSSAAPGGWLSLKEFTAAVQLGTISADAPATLSLRVPVAVLDDAAFVAGSAPRSAGSLTWSFATLADVTDPLS